MISLLKKHALGVASGTSITAIGWKTLASLLAKQGVRLVGWPFNADTPAERDSQKGLAGLPNSMLQMLFDAMKRTDGDALSFITLNDEDKDRKPSLVHNLFCLI
jgi:hypothetical protein